jgi:hypothetical protein
MKKILLSLCFLTASFAAFAQLPTIGIKGGVNFSDLQISAKNTSATANLGNLTTFSVGAFVDFKAGTNFSIQPAILYTGKGGKVDGGQDGSAKINLYYLDVPINFLYHVPAVVGDFYFGGGPYAAMGVSGKGKIAFDGNEQSEDVKFGSDGDFKRIEGGLTGLVGFKFKTGFLVNANYDLGLTNIANDSGDSKLKTRVFGISVGYAF